jgi:hypothetical protein
MPDYVPILDTQIEPDAPLTAVLAGQWRDNWIAGFEGSDGAPKLRRKALQNLFMGAVSSTETSDAITGIQDVLKFVGHIYIFNTTNNGFFEIRFSDDGGVNWTGWTTIRDIPITTVSLIVHIDIEAGEFICTADDGVGVSTGTLLLPGGDVDSFQIRARLTSGSARISGFFLATGGR